MSGIGCLILFSENSGAYDSGVCVLKALEPSLPCRENSGAYDSGVCVLMINFVILGEAL